MASLSTPGYGKSSAETEAYLRAAAALSTVVKPTTEKHPPSEPALPLDVKAIEAELRQLRGDASNGTIDAAWKDFDTKRGKVGALPAMGVLEARARYEELEARRSALSARTQEISSFCLTITHPSAISHENKTYIQYLAHSWKTELRALCGDGFSGEIDRAWKEYDRLKAISSGSSETAAAFAQYDKLDKRAKFLNGCIDASTAYLASENSTSIPAAIATLSGLIPELTVEQGTFAQDLRKLTGEHMDGEIDKAWKTFEALQAQEHYQHLDARCKHLEAILIELTSKAHPVAVAVGHTAPVAAAHAFAEPSHPAHDFKTVKDLITGFDPFWKTHLAKYEGIPFDEANFKKLCGACIRMFTPAFDPKTHFGTVEKRIVEPGTKIFVRADLHGDLKSLTENLKSLQQQGLLDASFKCTPGTQLVFLGDYTDRGECTMEVLQVLMTLRMENPEQVTLIRGNHESIDINIMYCGADENFKSFLSEADGCTLKAENRKLLTAFYNTLALSMFMGERSDSGQTQYTMFTHGLFELYADPQPILTSHSPSSKMAIPIAPIGGVAMAKGVSDQLSARVKSIPCTFVKDYKAVLAATKDKAERKKIKQEWAAARIQSLANHDRRNFSVEGLTAFNWGDMTTEESFPGDMGARCWKMSAQDVKHYMRLISSPSGKVKLVFRGHEHLKQHHTLPSGKVVVTTLPVGMDSAYKARFPGQKDAAYVITTKPKVKDWEKVLMERDPGTSKTTLGRSRKVQDAFG